ncbi:MAG: glutamine synthetase [Elusimicrobia bacterium]|nr:glutamine synthetase [Elusimicrobiota bacterium]
MKTNHRKNPASNARHPKLEALKTWINRGLVDTVMMVMPDMQGRWVGKRITAPFFLDSVATNGIHACSYLLTVDMEMEPLPGFKLTSWDRGYQDFHLTPDWNTARQIPWLSKTALVICDAADDSGNPIEAAPRRILRRQIDRAAQLGFRPMMGSELEFYLFKETYDSSRQKNYHGLVPFGSYIEDYHMLQGTKEEVINQDIRNLMEAAQVPVECSKGEWGPGQHEINLRYADALEMADRHTVYKHGAKEIAMTKNLALTFMAKYDAKLAGSSFHLHSSIWDPSGKRSLFWNNSKLTDIFRYYLGGQMVLAREMSLFWAPTINSYKRYQSATFAPTRIAWGRDNRTCGFRVIGHGNSLRVENRIPGADANPYLAFAATIAAGLYGIKNKVGLPPETKTNAYEGAVAPHVPKTMFEALATLQKSKAAKEAFGEEVIEHYLRYFELELLAYEKSVTCWERERYFERI